MSTGGDDGGGGGLSEADVETIVERGLKRTHFTSFGGDNATTGFKVFRPDPPDAGNDGGLIQHGPELELKTLLPSADLFITASNSVENALQFTVNPALRTAVDDCVAQVALCVQATSAEVIDELKRQVEGADPTPTPEEGSQYPFDTLKDRLDSLEGLVKGSTGLFQSTNPIVADDDASGAFDVDRELVTDGSVTEVPDVNGLGWTTGELVTQGVAGQLFTQLGLLRQIRDQLGEWTSITGPPTTTTVDGPSLPTGIARYNSYIQRLTLFAPGSDAPLVNFNIPNSDQSGPYLYQESLQLFQVGGDVGLAPNYPNSSFLRYGYYIKDVDGRSLPAGTRFYFPLEKKAVYDEAQQTLTLLTSDPEKGWEPDGVIESFYHGATFTGTLMFMNASMADLGATFQNAFAVGGNSVDYTRVTMTDADGNPLTYGTTRFYFAFTNPFPPTEVAGPPTTVTTPGTVVNTFSPMDIRAMRDRIVSLHTQLTALQATVAGYDIAQVQPIRNNLQALTTRVLTLEQVDATEQNFYANQRLQPPPQN